MSAETVSMRWANALTQLSKSKKATRARFCVASCIRTCRATAEASSAPAKSDTASVGNCDRRKTSRPVGELVDREERDEDACVEIDSPLVFVPHLAHDGPRVLISGDSRQPTGIQPSDALQRDTL